MKRYSTIGIICLIGLVFTQCKPYASGHPFVRGSVIRNYYINSPGGRFEQIGYFKSNDIKNLWFEISLASGPNDPGSPLVARLGKGNTPQSMAVYNTEKVKMPRPDTITGSTYTIYYLNGDQVVILLNKPPFPGYPQVFYCTLVKNAKKTKVEVR